MNTEKRKRIVELANNKKEREKNFIKRFTEAPEILEKMGYWAFWSINRILWYNAYFIKNNISEGKQYMYNAGSMIDLDKENHTVEIWANFSLKLATLLLSDNQELIKSFLKWKYKDAYGDYKVVGFGPIIQKLLAKNQRFAEIELEKYYHFKPNYKVEDLYLFKYDELIMKSLVKGDTLGIKEGIEYLVSESIHIGRLGDDYDTNFEVDFLSFPAVTILKSAWLLGHKIEIDSPYIPMDLMPVRPLEKYEVPYFFMEGYEGEIPEAYLKWKAEQALKPKEAPKEEKEAEIIWDKELFDTWQEANILGNANQRGYELIRLENGDTEIKTKEGKKIAIWERAHNRLKPLDAEGISFIF